MELIDKINYTQLVYLCYRVARHFGDLVYTRKLVRKITINGALPNVSKFYEKAVNLGWKLEHWKCENTSDDLKFYVEMFWENHYIY